MKKGKNLTMKNIHNIGRIVLLVLFMAGISPSCTNLDEELYSDVTPEDFLQAEEQFVSALGTAYSSLAGYGSGGSLSLHETSTDEMVVPTRGSDWDDGGHWRRLHLHSWNFEDPEINGAWGFYFTGVSNCNLNIAMFESLVEEGRVSAEDAGAFISELKVLRSFFYWLLMDSFGNVPIVDDFFNTPAEPATEDRELVFDFIVNSLAEEVPKLSKARDGTTYGRMNYWAGRTLQAKIFLNAEVYTGTPRWDDVIAACDDIINNGGFSLEGDYFSNFSAQNTGTNEMIFAIPYDQVFLTGFNMNMRTLHYGSQQTFNLTAQPWNGFCTLEEFYNSYEDGDLRKGQPGTLDGPSPVRSNFLAGYQYKTDGDLVTDSGWEQANPANPEKPVDPDGAPLNLGNIGTGAPVIHELGPNALRQDGIRINKWEHELGATDNMNNDFAVFRYADVLLMKAEAVWRQSGSASDATALALVNQIRERADVDPISSLDGPLSFDMAAGSVSGGELFNERGREMFAEHDRRRDLIRWGFFTDVDKWALPANNPGDVINTSDRTLIFPIPRERLDANKNLVQNPGY
jgi:starch-binding outer membrane protein, SusD/RagB family